MSIKHTEDFKLESKSNRLNRGGFPKGRISDSSYWLGLEASMDAALFERFAGSHCCGDGNWHELPRSERALCHCPEHGGELASAVSANEELCALGHWREPPLEAGHRVPQVPR